MTSHYRELTKDISSKLREFREDIPQTMSGFNQMAQACHVEAALSSKSKELIATAIAIAGRCQGCLGFHAKACVRAGVTREEFEEMVQVAIYIGGGPSIMTGTEAMLAYEEFGGQAK